jgi:hypothetical protein
MYSDKVVKPLRLAASVAVSLSASGNRIDRVFIPGCLGVAYLSTLYHPLAFIRQRYGLLPNTQLTQAPLATVNKGFQV